MITPKMAEGIIGKKIVEVVSSIPDGGYYKDYSNSNNRLQVSAGKAYIKLDDGSILEFWNSEWGGINILKPSGSPPYEYIEAKRKFEEKEG